MKKTSIQFLNTILSIACGAALALLLFALFFYLPLWLFPSKNIAAPPAVYTSYIVDRVADVACFTMDALRVEGKMYHAHMHNQCPAKTPGLLVTIAFYDADGVRRGFGQFFVEPLAPDEHSRFDDRVPAAAWTWSARLYQVVPVSRNQMEFKRNVMEFKWTK